MDLNLFFKDENLTPTAKVMYLYLRHLCEEECFDEVDLSNSELQKALCIKNLNTLVHCKKQLIEAGLIRTSYIYSEHADYKKMVIIKSNKILATTYKVTL